MKQSKNLVLLLFLATGHGMHAADEQPAKWYEMYHENWYGMCEGDSQFKCPNPFDDLMFGDNDQIQFRFSLEEWINHKNKNGRTFLHQAVQENNIKIVEKIIEHGADVNLQDVEGITALDWAVALAKFNNDEIIQLLLIAGADVNRKNIFGDTPLYVAAKRNNRNAMFSLLLAGANPKITSKGGRTARDLMIGSDTMLIMLDRFDN